MEDCNNNKKTVIHLGCKILSQGSLFLISCVLSVGRHWCKANMSYVIFQPNALCSGGLWFFFFFFLFQVIKPVREKNVKCHFAHFFFPFSTLIKVGTFSSLSLSKDDTVVSEDIVHTFKFSGRGFGKAACYLYSKQKGVNGFIENQYALVKCHSLLCF